MGDDTLTNASVCQISRIRAILLCACLSRPSETYRQRNINSKHTVHTERYDGRFLQEGINHIAIPGILTYFDLTVNGFGRAVRRQPWRMWFIFEGIV